MTKTPQTTTCAVTCNADPSCECAKTSKKPLKYGAAFVGLCALCCAIPPALVGLGLMTLTTGTYLSFGLTVTLVVIGTLGVGYLLLKYRNR